MRCACRAPAQTPPPRAPGTAAGAAALLGGRRSSAPSRAARGPVRGHWAERLGAELRAALQPPGPRSRTRPGPANAQPGRRPRAPRRPRPLRRAPPGAARGPPPGRGADSPQGCAYSSPFITKLRSLFNGSFYMV